MPERPNAPTTAAEFAESVGVFAESLASNFNQPIQAHPEDQLKGPVGELLRAAGQLVGLSVNWRTEVHADDIDGRPDIGVTTNGLLAGHVELKRPGLGARAERLTGRNRIQWQHFKALPNLIYTDGSEWSLYRTGELKQRVRIADDVSEDGARQLDSTATEDLRELLRDFLYWEPLVPGTAEGLARFLAPLARLLRDEVRKALCRESSQLHSLAKEWGGLLFPEGDDAQFADAYAQTVTYALLLARFEGAESLRPLIAVDALQREHGLLAEALQLLEATPVREELNMPIELLERAIGAVDSAKIGRRGDPWLYFYEQFLGAYDPKLRKDRGVYYTPVEVVRAQVRLAGELLRKRFKKPLAFADNDVVTLDPAVGTGTYPLAVLDHATDAVRGRLGPGAVSGKLRDLADRLHAFEILVGPYSVAHLRLSQRLRDAGVTDKTPKVYLTDTLESPNQMPDFKASLLQARLTEERKRALAVKKDLRVFVCLGNPPYDRQERDMEDRNGQRKGGWVRYGDGGEGASPSILEDFLAPVREAGQGLHLKNLYNDYVYFWRWALWKVLDSTEGAGIVSFITASSYLRGPGFAGMRRKMREVFDELWIIDLEGDNLGARKTENVFAIQTPVAIAVGVRIGAPRPDVPAKVWKVKLNGSQHTKLETLHAVESFHDLKWRECSSEWDAPFYPAGTGEYFDWPVVTDVFPWQQSGVKAGRTWPISAERETLELRWRKLVSAGRESRRKMFVDRPTGRKTTDSPPVLRPGLGQPPTVQQLRSSAVTPNAERYSYRSFDRQYVLADARLLDRPGPPLWAAHGDRQLYITSLLTNVLGVGPAAVATAAIPDLDHFRGSFGAKHVIPLWRDAEATRPNIASEIVKYISEVQGQAVPPERLFAYTYSILAQPDYVQRFWEELELPPPRLPISKDKGLFQRVADHGARLLYLHTYGERFAGPKDDGSVPQGTARCTKAVPSDKYPESFNYNEKTQVLHVGEGEFSPVALEVWRYSVSGLQVVKSWLDYRKLNRAGKRSSPLDNIRPAQWDFAEELLELLWVLEETLRLQPEGAALLETVCASTLFTAQELPTPTDEERRPPRMTRPAEGQKELPTTEPD